MCAQQLAQAGAQKNSQVQRHCSDKVLSHALILPLLGPRPISARASCHRKGVDLSHPFFSEALDYRPGVHCRDGRLLQQETPGSRGRAWPEHVELLEVQDERWSVVDSIGKIREDLRAQQEPVGPGRQVASGVAAEHEQGSFAGDAEEGPERPDSTNSQASDGFTLSLELGPESAGPLVQQGVVDTVLLSVYDCDRFAELYEHASVLDAPHYHPDALERSGYQLVHTSPRFKHSVAAREPDPGAGAEDVGVGGHEPNIESLLQGVMESCTEHRASGQGSWTFYRWVRPKRRSSNR